MKADVVRASERSEPWRIGQFWIEYVMSFGPEDGSMWNQKFWPLNSMSPQIR